MYSSITVFDRRQQRDQLRQIISKLNTQRIEGKKEKCIRQQTSNIKLATENYIDLLTRLNNIVYIKYRISNFDKI